MSDAKSRSLAPLLNVRRGVEAIEFYKRAFGAAELFRTESEDGSVVAQLSLGDSTFWLADEAPEHQNASPETLGGSSLRMIFVVDDPDATFDKAVAEGATCVWPVADQSYGWRVGRIVDPFGHHWEISKPVEHHS